PPPRESPASMPCLPRSPKSAANGSGSLVQPSPLGSPYLRSSCTKTKPTPSPTPTPSSSPTSTTPPATRSSMTPSSRPSPSPCANPPSSTSSPTKKSPPPSVS